MWDLIFGVAGGVTLYKILADLGGLVLVLVAVGGYAALTWRHVRRKTDLRFQLAQLLFFAVALGLGVAILVGWVPVG